MCCKNSWKKTIPFLLTFTIGILATNSSLLPKEKSTVGIQEKSFVSSIPTTSGKGVSSGFCKSNSLNNQKYYLNPNLEQKALQIISKPQPRYTDLARQNNIEGKIVLRVKFTKNERIGKVEIVTGLPDGLNEQSIAAAWKIKFKPVIRNGKPITISKTIAYKFTLQ